MVIVCLIYHLIKYFFVCGLNIIPGNAILGHTIIIWLIVGGFPCPNDHRLFCVILWQSKKCKSVSLDRMESNFLVRITKGLMRLRGWR